jgi:hypothetical protein
VTNNEIIEVAKEANRIVRALNEEKGDHDALANRLHQIMGGVSYPEHPLLRFAMGMLEGRRQCVYDDDPETMRRFDSLAADIGARNKEAWTLLPGVSGTGAAYEPPDQH